MTRFEAIGVDRVLSTRTVADCDKTFKKSCHICSTQGKRIECTGCAINHAHTKMRQLISTDQLKQYIA